MISTTDIRVFFNSLEDYEKFRTEWTLACLKINPESRNKTNRLNWKEQKQ